jgi:ACS family D-galactonate transporter-like MFS transporter
VFVSTLAPEHLIGLTGGVFNFFGGLAGIIVPAVIGYIVTDSNFTPAIILIGVMGILGAMSYVFLVGKVERVKTGNNGR